jgi:4,5:9,10-diseco-3-hydroxy-5,9,17-trioxoandrosta-1(10),2-diene-4-oate hydrolase
VINISLSVPEVLAALGADEPVEHVQAAGTRVAIKRWGAGPPVLCLHATGHGGGDFAEFARRVSDRFEVIALDWPGQGRSPPEDGPPRAARYAEIVLGLCDALRLDRPILIGNSIGGAAALEAAHRAPSKFRALVLCNPGGLAPVDAIARFAIERMVAFFEAGARGAPWFDAAFAAYYRRLVLPRAPALAQRERIIAAGRALAPLLAQSWRGFAEPEADLRALPAQLSIPVWLAWAKSDRLVSWERSRRAALRFPNRKVTLFRGGHAAFLEDPDRFATHFRAFFHAHPALPSTGDQSGHGTSRLVGSSAP